MQAFVHRHFLSKKDNIRFMLFVAAAFLLIVIGSANKNQPFQLLPAQNQLIDSNPKHSGLPHIHKPTNSKLSIRKA